MWISKKEYNEIVTEADKVSELRNRNVELNERYNFMVMKSGTEIAELRKQLEHYKKMYLEEQHKRLELAEMVRKMEGE